MKITAKQTRAGMVFGTGSKRLTATKRIGVVLWDSTEGTLFAPDTWDLLGCDPAIAARSDCEQFSIAPGCDAATHGFARLRDGGAVDLRKAANLRTGMVFRDFRSGAVLFVNGENLASAKWAPVWEENAPHWRFLGLSTSTHSGRELRRRLCCDDHNSYMDSCCSLPIGDHAEHEDIASGVKWPAKAAPALGQFAADVLGLDANGFRFEDDGGRLRPTGGDLRPHMGVAFPTTWLDSGKPLYPDTFARMAEAISGNEGGLHVPSVGGRPRAPNANGSGWVYYLPTGPVFVEDAAVAGQAVKRAESTPLLTIGALHVSEFTIANPVGGARVVEFTVPDAECHAAMKYLSNYLPIEVRGRDKTVTGHAVKWAHGPVSRDVEWFAVTFRESGDVAAPAPQAPKVSPCDSSLSGLYIASRRYDCTVHAPAMRGGDNRIDFEAPMVTDADREAYYVMRDHLEAGRDCKLRAGNSTVVGQAVRWSRAADPQRRGVEKFTVTFRPSNEQATAPAAPKVCPTAARDAAVTKAVADVPNGCSAAGWRNVVHVLAADCHENFPSLDWWNTRHFETDSLEAYCLAYERERRAGYGKEQAAERVRDGSTAVLRLLAAYEAGR
jgi:hypothetical protein